MASRYPDVQSAFAAIDESTTALGVRVKVLIDAINSTPGDGLDGPQTEWVLSQLATIKTNLDATAHNPNAPIPEPLPEPEPIPGGDGNAESFRGRGNR